jgi:hypothetical protein
MSKGGKAAYAAFLKSLDPELDKRAIQILQREADSKERSRRFKAARGSKTRSSFAWAQANRMTQRLVPIDVTSPYVSYQPPGPCLPLMEMIPSMSYQNLTEWWVLKIRGRIAKVMRVGFSKCCAPLKYCGSIKCAKCWAFKQKLPKQWRIVLREVPTRDSIKVVDTFGIDPKGKRSPGKAMAIDDRARYRLTSTQAAYRPGASGW